jgi:hypothetical protein
VGALSSVLDGVEALAKSLMDALRSSLGCYPTGANLRLEAELLGTLSGALLLFLVSSVFFCHLSESQTQYTSQVSQILLFQPVKSHTISQWLLSSMSDGLVS